MCGIVGMYKNAEVNYSDKEDLLNAAKQIKHRGPDSTNTWQGKNIIIVHNKLSILDYSDRSNQPIEFQGVVVALNGEIYNYKELIKKYNMNKEYIDVHVIARMYEIIGIDFLNEINGDFSIVLYDKIANKLYLIRDRLGVKQILYTIKNNDIYFASEVKAFYSLDQIIIKPSYERIVSDLCMWFWSDKEQSYFEDIYHVNPGEYIEVNSSGINKCKYWDINTNSRKKLNINDIEKRLVKSTLDRLQGEAKYATLLSGGLDSSLLTAIISKNVEKLTAYTIKYDVEENNEDYCFSKDIINKYSNINHIVNIVTKNDVTIQKLDKLTYFMEEVIWDKVYFSMYTNYKEAAEDGFRIIINGQGSDEVWLGYFYDFNHYSEEVNTDEKLYHYFINTYIGEEDYLTKEAQFQLRLCISKVLKKYMKKEWLRKDYLQSVAYWATKTYLQSNLMQEDRLAMLSSVECRVPFTDYKFVEMAFDIKSDDKVKNSIEKFPIKKVGERYIPLKIVDRRKQAFVNPSESYNQYIIEYFKSNFNNIFEHDIIKRIFSKKFISKMKESLSLMQIDIIWKIVAIYRFISIIEGDDNCAIWSK